MTMIARTVMKTVRKKRTNLSLRRRKVHYECFDCFNDTVYAVRLYKSIKTITYKTVNKGKIFEIEIWKSHVNIENGYNFERNIPWFYIYKNVCYIETSIKETKLCFSTSFL